MIRRQGFLDGDDQPKSQFAKVLKSMNHADLLDKKQPVRSILIDHGTKYQLQHEGFGIGQYKRIKDRFRLRQRRIELRQGLLRRWEGLVDEQKSKLPQRDN